MRIYRSQILNVKVTKFGGNICYTHTHASYTENFRVHFCTGSKFDESGEECILPVPEFIIIKILIG